MATTIDDILGLSTREEERLKQDVWLEAIYWLEIHLAKLAAELARFKRDLKEKLEWISTHEEEANNAIFIAFCLLNLGFFLFPATSVSIAKSNLWNLFEGIAALLASPRNFMAAQSIPEMLIFVNNAIGIGTLFACIPVCILIATGCLVMPVLPHILVLAACYSDVVSYGYAFYKAIKNNEPDIKEKGLSLASITFTAVGFTLLSIAPLFAACPPLALGLVAAGFVCLGISALIRATQLIQKKSANKTTALASDDSKAVAIPQAKPVMPLKVSDKRCALWFRKPPPPIPDLPSSIPLPALA